jgi:hypothetical protein
MDAVGFLIEHWTSRETAQLALKFGLLLAPIAWFWWAPARRQAGRLVVAFGAATGVLLLVIAYVQVAEGRFTASLNRWEDSRFAVEVAGYQLAFVAVGAWCALRRRGDSAHGVALALLAWAAVAAAVNLSMGGRAAMIVQLGTWAAGLGAALLASAALARTSWLRAQLAVVALAFVGFALVHLHDWLVEGELAMGHVGPSLWHDLAFPAAAAWVISRR